MLWNSVVPPTVYIFADKVVADAISSIGYTGNLVVKTSLDAYSYKTRAEMERTLATQEKSLWYEFQMEKIRLLNWVFSSESSASQVGVFYFDADICFFGELPSVQDGFDVAVSPHMICKMDETRYGRYNAGYFWTRTLDAVQAWRSACMTSRFFEQAALEVFDSDEWSGVGRVYKFPIQMNYGWWRMFQSDTDYAELQKSWGIRRNAKYSGITVDGQPLISVHTHWTTANFTTGLFNNFIKNFLKKIAPMHEPAKRLLSILSRNSK